MTISDFHGRYFFLDNFYPSPIGKGYPTVEHYFQAHKARTKATHERIRLAPDPGTAKALGRATALVRGWDTVKFEVMRKALAMKFADKHLQNLLLATGDEELVEGNTWGDTIWGVCNGVGENHLGRMLMDIRSRLKRGLSP